MLIPCPKCLAKGYISVYGLSAVCPECEGSGRTVCLHRTYTRQSNGAMDCADCQTTIIPNDPALIEAYSGPAYKGKLIILEDVK